MNTFHENSPIFVAFFDHRHLWAHLLFSSLLGGDLDFGMEVHVNSFQQITKEDQHRRESRKIFTPQTGRFGATKHTNNSSKQTKKQKMINTTTQLRIGFNTVPLYGTPNLITMHSTASAWVGKWYSETCKKSSTLKAAELTIMDRVSFQISSIQAAPQYAEYQMVRTKLVQIFPFNWPLGPHWPPSTQRRHSAVFIFRINLWLCQIDAHKIFCNATIHWNTNDFQWKIILLQRIQMYQ